MPFQVFLVYAALVCFVYLATDGFQNNAPFVFTLPVVVLGWFTLWTRMPRRTRVLTAVSFFTLALALYSWSMFPKKLELSALLICLSHGTYLLSFYHSLRKWWIALAVTTVFVVSLFLYGIFADLFRSIPALVFAMCATLLFSTVSFVVAGSVWKNGSAMLYEERSTLVRFFGTFFLLICNAALLINHFGRSTSTLVCYLNFTYYCSQFLLYFANERAF